MIVSFFKVVMMDLGFSQFSQSAAPRPDCVVLWVRVLLHYGDQQKRPHHVQVSKFSGKCRNVIDPVPFADDFWSHVVGSWARSNGGHHRAAVPCPRVRLHYLSGRLHGCYQEDLAVASVLPWYGRIFVSFLRFFGLNVLLVLRQHDLRARQHEGLVVTHDDRAEEILDTDDDGRRVHSARVEAQDERAALRVYDDPGCHRGCSQRPHIQLGGKRAEQQNVIHFILNEPSSRVTCSCSWTTSALPPTASSWRRSSIARISVRRTRPFQSDGDDIIIIAGKYGLMFYNSLLVFLPATLLALHTGELEKVRNFHGWGNVFFTLQFCLSCVFGFILVRHSLVLLCFLAIFDTLRRC